MIAVTLYLLGTVVALFWIYSRYKLDYWKRRGVESLAKNQTHWIFGNFKDAVLFRSSPGWHLGEIYRAARPDAPFVGFYIFHKPCLLLRDPEIIKHILIRDFDNFSDRHFGGFTQKESTGMKNLLGLKNPAWKYVRSKITPTLTSTKLKQLFLLMLETGEPMMRYLRNCTRSSKNEPNPGKLVDAQEVNDLYTTDLFASVALGTKIDSFLHPNAAFSAAVADYLHGFKRMIAQVIVFFLPELVDLIGTRVLVKPDFMEKVFWCAMEDREKNGQRRGDYIDSLLELKNGQQDPQYKFEGENLLYQSGMFLSGFESSSTMASFTLMELAKHPNCQELVRQDVNRAIDKYGWTYEAFNKMKYLDQAIAEGLRLHPAISTIDRYTLQDYKVPGTDVIIEKGTPIYISLYGLQGDPKYFHEPEQFKPERFANDSMVSDAYIPFGIGPRMCIGVKVGQLHTKVVIAMLLREYKVWQPEGHESVLDPRSSLTAAASGIKLHFKKISS